MKRSRARFAGLPLPRSHICIWQYGNRLLPRRGTDRAAGREFT